MLSEQGSHRGNKVKGEEKFRKSELGKSIMQCPKPYFSDYPNGGGARCSVTSDGFHGCSGDPEERRGMWLPRHTRDLRRSTQAGCAT